MSSKTYVMFGYSLSDIEMTAYLGKDLTLVTELSAARRFSSKKTKGQKGFGTPEQWVDYINDDATINKGYKFHLVPVV